MSPPQNFRYTIPFQGLGWRSQLFRGGQEKEESRLANLVKEIPVFEVHFNPNKFAAYHSVSRQRQKAALAELSGRLQQNHNLTADEQWILKWSMDPSQSSTISAASYEILACHNILDIGAYLLEPTKGSSLVESSSPFTHREILTAHELVSKKLFNVIGTSLVSTILASAKSAVGEYLIMSPSKPDSSPQDKRTPASLAKSAMYHKTMSVGAHVLYNLEITAALLSYLVEKVRIILFSVFYLIVYREQ